MTVLICLVKVLTEIHYRLKQDNIVTTAKIDIYDQGYGEKRVKVAVIMGHFEQTLCILCL